MMSSSSLTASRGPGRFLASTVEGYLPGNLFCDELLPLPRERATIRGRSVPIDGALAHAGRPGRRPTGFSRGRIKSVVPFRVDLPPLYVLFDCRVELGTQLRHMTLFFNGTAVREDRDNKGRIGEIEMRGTEAECFALVEPGRAQFRIVPLCYAEAESRGIIRRRLGKRFRGLR